MNSIRTLLLSTPLLLLAIVNASDKRETSINLEKEKEAIMAVIDGESRGFWQKDFDLWASHWAHEDYIRVRGWWNDGGIFTVNGWEENSRNIKTLMEENPEPNPTAANVRRENINLRVSGKMAWLTFDQYGDDTGDARMDMPGLSRETRILEKQVDGWKIVYVGWLLEGET